MLQTFVGAVTALALLFFSFGLASAQYGATIAQAFGIQGLTFLSAAVIAVCATSMLVGASRSGRGVETVLTRALARVYIDSRLLRSTGMPRVTNRFLRLRDERTPDSGRVASRASVPPPLAISRAEFYREELLKHQQCLEAQREYYSERAVAEVEEAIGQTIARLEQLCTHCDCDHIVSCVLRKLDQVTNLSAWSDPKTLH
jgi:hypothetical protein